MDKSIVPTVGEEEELTGIHEFITTCVRKLFLEL
jgi:hypothetical protein